MTQPDIFFSFQVLLKHKRSQTWKFLKIIKHYIIEVEIPILNLKVEAAAKLKRDKIKTKVCFHEPWNLSTRNKIRQHERESIYLFGWLKRRAKGRMNQESHAKKASFCHGSSRLPGSNQIYLKTFTNTQ